MNAESGIADPVFQEPNAKMRSKILQYIFATQKHQFEQKTHYQIQME